MFRFLIPSCTFLSFALWKQNSGLYFEWFFLWFCAQWWFKRVILISEKRKTLYYDSLLFPFAQYNVAKWISLRERFNLTICFRFFVVFFLLIRNANSTKQRISRFCLYVLCNNFFFARSIYMASHNLHKCWYYKIFYKSCIQHMIPKKQEFIISTGKNVSKRIEQYSQQHLFIDNRTQCYRSFHLKSEWL